MAAVEAGVNWFGLEWQERVFHGLNVSSLDHISDFISENFNVLRVPFSVEFALSDPTAVLHNESYVGPELQGKSTMEILDAVVDAMATRGVLVMLVST